LELGLISSALARNTVLESGSSGGGYALLIILASGIAFGFSFAGYKKWRRRNEDADTETPLAPR
jgi:hypothetical protein